MIGVVGWKVHINVSVFGALQSPASGPQLL